MAMIPVIREWIERYRDVKEVHFGNLEPEKPFFVNYLGNALSDSADTAIWRTFNKVTGIARANLTQIR